MKTLSCFLLFSLGVIPFFPSKSNGQLVDDILWGWGTIPHNTPCTKDGYDALPGLIQDPWIINAHCITYNGTVGCFDNNCECNQKDDAYFVPNYNNLEGTCLGYVGAVCSAEHSNLFPDKMCTPNAECIPDVVNEMGRALGTCRCIQGYQEGEAGSKDARKCVRDPEIPEGSPRTTTTTVAPPKEPLKLPPLLGFLLDINWADLDESCNPRALLNRTFCNTHDSTVACISKKCQCNMMQDSVFDEKLNMCVGLAGTSCLGRRFLLGYKACTEYADCVLEGETTLDQYSFGTCECIGGYKENEDGSGTCVRDDAVSNPSTQRTIKPPPVPTTQTPPRTTRTYSGASGIFSSVYTTNVLVAILYMMYRLV